MCVWTKSCCGQDIFVVTKGDVIHESQCIHTVHNLSAVPSTLREMVK